MLIILILNRTKCPVTQKKPPSGPTKMAFIKLEHEDMKIEETFRVKHEDTEEQTGWFSFSKLNLSCVEVTICRLWPRLPYSRCLFCRGGNRQRPHDTILSRYLSRYNIIAILNIMRYTSICCNLLPFSNFKLCPQRKTLATSVLTKKKHSS